MKISSLKKIAGVFLALVLGTSTAFSQGRRCRYPDNSGTNQRLFINRIDNLSEKQSTDINTVIKTHQETMSELYKKNQAVADPDQRLANRIEQLQAIRKHRNSIREILTADQKKQMDLNYRNQNYNRRGGGFGYRQCNVTGYRNRQGSENNYLPRSGRNSRGFNCPRTGYGNRFGYGPNQ